MMMSYFAAFCNAHKMKTALLIFIISVFFGLTVTILILGNSLPEITSLPFKGIGVETIVQKTGQIPNKMVGAIFPHSNGPIYEKEIADLSALSFTEDYDKALYFWYFDDSFFNDVLDNIL